MNDPQVPELLSTRVRLRTRWCDEDNQAVLNNAVYMTLFEEGRRAYFEQLGLIEENRFPFLLAQTNVRFLRPGAGGVDDLFDEKGIGGAERISHQVESIRDLLKQGVRISTGRQLAGVRGLHAALDRE